MSGATLNGHRVTYARVSLPAWRCWYADASLDGEVTLSGPVELVVADLTLRGTVLSGGPAKGRSHFRIIAGAGGWGKTLAKRSYANDAGVKLATIVGDAATAAGEVFEAPSTNTIVGPSYTRPEGQASRVLELEAPSGWYVGEDGVTRLGRRPATPLHASVTHGPVDLAAGTVTLAGESIATILPGVVVDGLEALDVMHEISAKGGLRSTIWGKLGASSSRRIDAFRAIVEQLDPKRQFRGVTEYRVVTLEGERLNLQPVRVSTGMPDLRRVRARPGVPGCKAEAALGSRVLVGFADSDPALPFVSNYEDAEGEGFLPTSLSLLAGSAVGGEHVMTTEATALLIYNTLVALMAAAGGGPLIAAVLQPLLGAAVLAAIGAQSAPAPPGAIAQNALAATLLAGFATGVTPSNTSAFFASAIAAGAAKTPNVSGLFPSIGSAAVETG